MFHFLLRKLGVAGTILDATGFSTVVSLIITYFCTIFFKTPDVGNALIIATICPVLIAPVVVGVFIKLVDKLDKSIQTIEKTTKELEQTYEELRCRQEQHALAEKQATIGTMAEGMSHQINNRFAVISLLSNNSMYVLKTMEEVFPSEEVKAFLSELRNDLRQIESNVQMGADIVKGIIKYSRPGESGFEFIDVKDVLSGALEMVYYHINFKDKKIDFVVNVAEDLPKFNGNLAPLQEVLFDLIDNASKAIEARRLLQKDDNYPGKIEVRVVKTGSRIEFSVIDNGIGIEKDNIKKLFTPFFTTKSSSKEKTGIGLYVIEKIVSVHKGTIRVDSTYASGTCFTVSLPIQR